MLCLNHRYTSLVQKLTRETKKITDVTMTLKLLICISIMASLYQDRVMYIIWHFAVGPLFAVYNFALSHSINITLVRLLLSRIQIELRKTFHNDVRCINFVMSKCIQKNKYVTASVFMTTRACFWKMYACCKSLPMFKLESAISMKATFYTIN